MRDKFYDLFKFIGEYALYALLFCIPISNSLVEIFAGLMLFSFIGRKIINPDFKYVKFWPNIFLLLFLFFSALSLLNSGQYLNKSLHALFGKWMQYLGIYILVQDTIYSKEKIKFGMAVFLFSAFIVVLSGINQYFFGDEFIRQRGIAILEGGARAITSSFAHYNSLGAYLVVVLFLAVALLLENNSFSFQSVALSTLSIFSIGVIILTFSRGSWLGFMISSIFLFLLVRRNFMWLIPVFFVIIAMLILPAFQERLSLAFKAGGDNDRFKYWVVAFKMINEHPFLGVGLGTFMPNFVRLQPNLYMSYAHNCYLQIWAESGVFSLINFVFFVVSVICIGVERFFAAKDFILLGLLCGVIGFLVHSFFDNNLYSLRLAFLFWVWVGLIAAKAHITTNA